MPPTGAGLTLGKTRSPDAYVPGNLDMFCNASTTSLRKSTFWYATQFRYERRCRSWRALSEHGRNIPAAVTIYHGSTAIVSVPAAAALGQSAPYCVQLGIRATSASTGFKITTGASVSCIAVGRFS